MRTTLSLTGVRLTAALGVWTLRRDSEQAALTKSTSRYEAESAGPTPQDVTTRLLTAERTVAALQTAQMRYNLAVAVTAEGETMTLAEAVKRLGGLGRVATFWRGLSVPKANDRERHYGGEPSRDRTKDYPVPTYAAADALVAAEHHARAQRVLREAVGVANGTSVLIEGVDPAWFD